MNQKRAFFCIVLNFVSENEAIADEQLELTLDFLESNLNGDFDFDQEVDFYETLNEDSFIVRFQDSIDFLKDLSESTKQPMLEFLDFLLCEVEGVEDNEERLSLLAFLAEKWNVSLDKEDFGYLPQEEIVEEDD